MLGVVARLRPMYNRAVDRGGKLSRYHVVIVVTMVLLEGGCHSIDDGCHGIDSGCHGINSGYHGIYGDGREPNIQSTPFLGG